MHLIQLGKKSIALIKAKIEVPGVMDPAVSHRVDLKRCFDSDAKVVSCTAYRPEQIRMRVFRRVDDGAVRENKSARYHIVM